MTDRGNDDQTRLVHDKVAAPVLQLADSVKTDSIHANPEVEFEPVFDVEDVHEFDVNLIDELFAEGFELAT